jgi:hypothetical protein
MCTNVSEVLAAYIIKAIVLALMMEAARASEMLVHFYQTTGCYNPEDSHLRFRRCFIRIMSPDDGGSKHL